MTDHAKELEELALTAFGSSADALLLRAATELRLLEAENARMRANLDWYGEKAASANRYLSDKSGKFNNAIVALLQELSLDNGARGRID